MIARRTLFGFVVALVSAHSTQIFAQAGRPVSAADLSGKTICWSDGTRSTYAANGQYTNNKGGHTVWSVPKPGILHAGSKERQAEVLPDGRLYNYYLDSPHGGSQSLRREYWGTVCN
jgi:hypothetical protein